MHAPPHLTGPGPGTRAGRCRSGSRRRRTCPCRSSRHPCTRPPPWDPPAIHTIHGAAAHLGTQGWAILKQGRSSDESAEHLTGQIGQHAKRQFSMRAMRPHLLAHSGGGAAPPCVVHPDSIAGIEEGPERDKGWNAWRMCRSGDHAGLGSNSSAAFAGVWLIALLGICHDHACKRALLRQRSGVHAPVEAAERVLPNKLAFGGDCVIPARPAKTPIQNST